MANGTTSMFKKYLVLVTDYDGGKIKRSKKYFRKLDDAKAYQARENAKPHHIVSLCYYCSNAGFYKGMEYYGEGSIE